MTDRRAVSHIDLRSDPIEFHCDDGTVATMTADAFEALHKTAREWLDLRSRARFAAREMVELPEAVMREVQNLGGNGEP